MMVLLLLLLPFLLVVEEYVARGRHRPPADVVVASNVGPSLWLEASKGSKPQHGCEMFRPGEGRQNQHGVRRNAFASGTPIN